MEFFEDIFVSFKWYNMNKNDAGTGTQRQRQEVFWG